MKRSTGRLRRRRRDGEEGSGVSWERRGELSGLRLGLVEREPALAIGVQMFTKSVLWTCVGTDEGRRSERKGAELVVRLNGWRASRRMKFRSGMQEHKREGAREPTTGRGREFGGTMSMSPRHSLSPAREPFPPALP